MELGLQIAILITSLLGAFFFAGSETGFVSWNPLKVSHLAGQGNLFAKWALYLMTHKDRLISAVLIGNNVCIIASSLAFLFIFERIDEMVWLDLSRVPSPESWVLTPIMVLFGEMLPKSLFRTYSFRLTMKSMPVLMVLYWITFPFTWLFTAGAGLFHKQNREKGESFMAKVREEMVLIAVEGAKRGTLFESAKDFIDSTLKLKDRKISETMTPTREWNRERPVVRVSDTLERACEATVGYDELVVFDERGELPCGYVTVLDLVSAAPDTELRKLLRQLPTVNVDTTLLEALQQVDERSPRFLGVVSSANEPVGLLDRMDLFRTAFGRISPDLNPTMA